MEGESVVIHEFILGEIAMGSLKNRKAQLAFLSDLHFLPTAENYEVRVLIESAKLYGSGLSYIDVHLLAAALASPDTAPVRLWTRDKALNEQALQLGIAYLPQN
jgi:predicted nucleic acid-binding protein